MNREIIEQRTEQQKYSSTEWYAVTIQKENGHDTNGCFMTDDFILLRIFADEVSPHQVFYSTYQDKNECEEFLDQLDHSYVALEIIDYRTSA